MKRYAGRYEGQQYVGIDLHRRRSVVVRMTDGGELLEAVQIANSPLALPEVCWGRPSARCRDPE